MNGVQAETSTKATFGILIVASMALVLARIYEFVQIIYKLQGKEIKISDTLGAILFLYHQLSFVLLITAFPVNITRWHLIIIELKEKMNPYANWPLRKKILIGSMILLMVLLYASSLTMWATRGDL